jgi:hypothetical protein
LECHFCRLPSKQIANLNGCIDKLGKILKRHIPQSRITAACKIASSFHKLAIVCFRTQYVGTGLLPGASSRSEAMRTEIPRSADILDGDVRASFNHGVTINAGKDSLC